MVLFAISLASLMGATFHLSLFSEIWEVLLWQFVVGMIGISAVFLLYTLVSNLKKNYKCSILITYIALYFGSIFFSTNFSVTITMYLLVVLAVLIVSIKKKHNYLILFSILSFVAAALQMSKISLHEYFNFNDLYHLAQLSGFYFFYKHAKLIAKEV